MTSFALGLLQARAELYRRAMPHRRSIDYVRANGIDTDLVCGFCGCIAVLPILGFEGGYFDFSKEGTDGAVDACVVEAFERDGETTADLVAWPLDDPAAVFGMYRRAPLLGMWEAMNPYTYALGSPLQMHRTPLEWLQAGCKGAAVVTPALAARTLLDLPGKMAAKDGAHAADLDRLMRSVFDGNRVLVPRGRREAA